MTDWDGLWRDRFGLPLPDAAAGAAAALSTPGSLAGMLGRASCRDFRPDPVPDGLLTLLLACAQSAPSKSDLQQYSIIVVRDPAKRAAMQHWRSFDDWIGRAPAFLIFCADLRRQRRLADYNGLAHENDNLDSFMNTAVDAGVALATFVAAAEAAGLGCCPISMVRNHIEEACALFDLPGGVYPVAGLALGWPAAPSPRSMRLPPATVVHFDRYDDTGLETEIADYDARRHARQPIPPEKQRHPGRYGTADRVTWSQNAARQMSVPERYGFRSFLKKHGFALS